MFIEVSKQGILKEVCKEARDIVFLSYFGTPTISKIITLSKIMTLARCGRCMTVCEFFQTWEYSSKTRHPNPNALSWIWWNLDNFVAVLDGEIWLMHSHDFCGFGAQPATRDFDRAFACVRPRRVIIIAGCQSGMADMKRGYRGDDGWWWMGRCT